MDQLTQSTTPLSSLVDELRQRERFQRFVAALPTRARVSEPILPLLLAALHAELGGPLLVYAILARIPVLVIMWLAISRRWGTHYDAPPPSFPSLLPLPRWLWTGLLPQSTIWIAFTLAVGMLGAAAGVYLARRRRA